MGTKAEKAKELFEQGYNCSQAVIGVFCEELGMDFETAVKLSSSFGGGMGRMREVCGAVSGMFMAAGLQEGYTSPTDKKGKTKHYELIQKMAEEFKDKNGSIICRELLGIDADKNLSHIPSDRTKEYYQKRPCAELVKDAAEIFENICLNKK